MNNSITLVTAAVDLARSDRDFATHYLDSLKKIIQTSLPVVVFISRKYWAELLQINPRLSLVSLEIADIERYQHFTEIKSLVEQPSWYQQSAWMEHSVIKSAHYITLTLMKLSLLKSAQRIKPAERYIWLDSGFFSSYHINAAITDFDFYQIPDRKFFITSFPYRSESEIHGFSTQILEQLAGARHEYVSRATIFSANSTELDIVSELFDQLVADALNNHSIGTEEAIFTILCLKYPELFSRFAMTSGDIGHFFNSIKKI